MLAELNVKDFPNSWPKLTSTLGPLNPKGNVQSTTR
jgi:hypothetical protein